MECVWHVQVTICVVLERKRQGWENEKDVYLCVRTDSEEWKDKRDRKQNQQEEIATQRWQVGTRIHLLWYKLPLMQEEPVDSCGSTSIKKQKTNKQIEMSKLVASGKDNRNARSVCFVLEQHTCHASVLGVCRLVDPSTHHATQFRRTSKNQATI